MPIIMDMATGAQFRGRPTRGGNDIFGNAADMLGVGSQLAQGYNQNRQVDANIANAQQDNARADESLQLQHDQFGYRQTRDAIEEARQQNQQDFSQQNQAGNLDLRGQEQRLHERKFQAGRDDRTETQRNAQLAQQALAAQITEQETGLPPLLQGGGYSGPMASPRTPGLENVPVSMQIQLLKSRNAYEHSKEMEAQAQQRNAASQDYNQGRLGQGQQKIDLSRDQGQQRIDVQRQNAGNYAANTGAAGQNRIVARQIDGIQTNIRVATDRLKAAPAGSDLERQAQDDLTYWTGQLNNTTNLQAPPQVSAPRQEPGWWGRNVRGEKTSDQLADEAVQQGITDPEGIKAYIRSGGR